MKMWNKIFNKIQFHPTHTDICRQLLTQAAIYKFIFMSFIEYILSSNRQNYNIHSFIRQFVHLNELFIAQKKRTNKKIFPTTFL